MSYGKSVGSNHSKVDVIVLFLLLLMVCLTPMAVELKDGVFLQQSQFTKRIRGLCHGFNFLCVY